MATSDFLPFAASTGANVVTQSEFAGASWQVNGYTTGTASAPEANKVWRQASMIGAAWTSLVNSVLGQNVVDDGVVPTLASQFQQLVSNIANTSVGDLFTRMANAEANINSLLQRMANAEGGIQWLDGQVNALLGRMTTAEGNINNLLNWQTSMNGRAATWDQNIQYLLGQVANLNSWNSSQDSHLSNLDQQTAELMGTSNQGEPGFMRWANGFTIQWLLGNQETQSGNSDYTYNFAIGFTLVTAVSVSTIRPQGGGQSQDDIFEYQIISWTNAQVRIWRARRGNDNTITTQPWVVAYGWS